MQKNFLAEIKTQQITNLSNVKVVRNCGVVQIILTSAGIGNGDNMSSILGGYLPKVPTLGIVSNSNDLQLYFLRLNTDGTANIIDLGGSVISGAISAIGTITYLTDI